MTHSTSPALALFLTGLFFASSHAHSWNEQLQVIGSNGSYTGDCGYPRGYVPRSSSGFNDGDMTYLIPALSTNRVHVDSTDSLCHPSQRSPGETTSGYPKLQVAPNSYVAMKYIENGHVTNPLNQKGKPKGSGTVFVFGTTQPQADEKIVDVLQWTADGTGGDKRGKLLAAQNYDDGRCYQIDPNSPISAQRQQADPPLGNGGGLWCETDPKMPSDLVVGSQYTVYWLWSWPTAASADPIYPTGKDEYYSTCNDVEVVAGPIAGSVSHSLLQQDGNTLAVSGYESRTAYSATPTAITASGTPAAAASGQSGAAPTTTAAASLPTSSLSAAAGVPPAAVVALGASGSSYAYESASTSGSVAPANSAPSTALTSTLTAFQTITATLPPVHIVTETAVVTKFVNAPAAKRAVRHGARFGMLHAVVDV